MIVTKENNNNIDKLVFGLSLFMLISRKYITAFLYDNEFLMSIQSYLLYLPILILAVKFLIDRFHTKREIFAMAIIALLYVITSEGSLLVFTLLALAIQKIDDKFVVKSYFNIHIIFFITYITLALLLPDFASQGDYHYKFENGVKVLRGTFGLSNPNAAFYYLLPIYASYIYLRFEKYNIFDRILMVALTGLVYFVTSSRTGVIAVVGGLVFLEIIKRVDLKKQKLFSSLLKFSPLIFSIVSILIGTVFHHMDILNKILSSRPRNWNIYLVKRGNMFSLFGNNYTEGVRSMNPMDNSYIYLLCFLGLIAFILIMYALYKGLDSFIEEDNKKYITVAMIFFVYGLAENILLEASLNFTLLLILKRFISLDKGKKESIYNYKFYINEFKSLDLKNKIKRK